MIRYRQLIQNAWAPSAKKKAAKYAAKVLLYGNECICELQSCKNTFPVFTVNQGSKNSVIPVTVGIMVNGLEIIFTCEMNKVIYQPEVEHYHLYSCVLAIVDVRSNCLFKGVSTLSEIPSRDITRQAKLQTPDSR